jgi:hypothetical protein
MHQKERESREILDVKLKKKAINQEIAENFLVINESTFFE